MPPTPPQKRTSPWVRLAVSLALVATLVVSIVGLSVRAADPADGTVSDTQRTLEYTGGPGFIANGGDCTLTPCDDFMLTVAVPGGYEAGHELIVRVVASTPSADFDLIVQDGAGNEQATSGNPPGQSEAVLLPATAGQYVIRVVPFAVTPADTYTGMVTLRDKVQSSVPVQSNEVTPAYQNYNPPRELPDALSAGEPSIGVNWKTEKVFFQAYLTTFRVTFDDAVSPATATWEDKSGDIVNCTDPTTLDPILFTDEKEGLTIESQLFVNPVKNSAACVTRDDGENWLFSQGGGAGQGADHQTVGGGPYAPGTVPPARVTDYPNAIYYCSQAIAEAGCARSDDAGLTFGPSIPMYNLTQCAGLHGHVKVAPNDGTVYVPVPDCNGAQAVAVSEDSGTTWEVRIVTGTVAAPGSDPSVGIGADGTVYFGYQNGDGNARIAVSQDRGKTWFNDQDVGALKGIENAVWPAVVAGDGDRAAFAFHGTTTGGNYQAADFKGTWNLYVAHTYDRGASWTVSEVTPTDPIQKGCVWNGGGSNPCRNLLDFFDAVVDKDGRMLVGWADGCIDACINKSIEDLLRDAGSTGRNPADGFRTELSTISRQTTGKRLFAAADPVIPEVTTTPTTGATTAPTTAATTIPTTAATTSATTVPTTAATATMTSTPRVFTTTTATTSPTIGATTNPNTRRLFLPFVSR